MLEWAYSGVNSSVPRNVGPKCAEYLTPTRRVIETLIATILVTFAISWGLKRITLPKSTLYVNQDRLGKRILLIFMSLILGMEIGFKFSSKTVIYLLNPCHVTTMMQLYLLAAEPSQAVTAIFRIHLNLLNGPLLAYLFPETASRQIFVDKAIYYIQHGLMVVIPYYLLRVGGVYNVEPLSDLSWSVLSYGLNLAYHFWVLQAFALPAQVNLNHMLCPAVLDPFEGPNYRVWATIHQFLLCPILCKLFCVASNFLLTQFPVTRVEKWNQIPIDRPITEEVLPCKQIAIARDSTPQTGWENGHTHVD
ncbi:transmembrane protein 164 [Athalia rosae]|uniref:transmembrane protein 164 n=1 Tax=Athalia rosae TaxID=37344 RepID=UPI0020333855|nr:transmembrane protein 164 [Athalia rosae]XP_012262661.2 transmembrane protein 164 [Athalia rosae]XP_020710222.2 transmembrane protein 164 [Athalia rosae]XP_048508552.1 transmembrane protein 164 [Athalia rosae]XP_048508553.1 transmembrane protein 164 [Athalia rosae]XP_048508554.1 transmembrane protein 164 [Athalia rosae]